MTGVSRWMTQANARGVFYSAAAVLLLVTAWWVWKEISPSRLVFAPPRPAGKEPPSLDLALLSFLNDQHGEVRTRPFGDPFYHAVRFRRSPDEWMTARPPRSDTPSAPAPAAAPSAPAAPAAPTPPAPAAAPTPRMLSLRYHGMITRSDGTTVALIAEETAKKSFLLATGASTNGFTVGEIGMEKVEIQLSDGTATPIALHAAASIPESAP